MELDVETQKHQIEGLARAVLVALLVVGCASPRPSPAATTSAPTAKVALEIHGHRGARGRYPENTIDGFLGALNDGATVLETDLLLTRDGVLVIHHDEQLNPDTTRDVSGKWLTAPSEPIVTLTSAELASYDVGRLRPGSDYATRFPHQQGQDGVRIPTLADAITAIDKASGGRARWNLEIKIATDRPERTAAPEAVVDATLALVRARGLDDRVMIQSFDWRVIKRVHEVAPSMPTGCLSEPKRVTGNLPEMVAAEKCTYWTPKFDELDRAQVDAAHDLGLKVVPWTVNEPGDLTRIIGLGVDGVITDYPDRVARKN